MSQEHTLDMRFGPVRVQFESDELDEMEEQWARTKAAVDTYIEKSREMQASDEEDSNEGR